MDETLHPSTLSEILDQTIQIYRRRFLVFAGLAAAPYAAVLVPVSIFLLLGWWLGNLNSGTGKNAEIPILVIAGILVAAPVWIGVTALATGALNHAASHRYFGDRITIRGAWEEAWARGWGYSGLYLLEVLLIWVAPVFVCTLVFMGGAAMAALGRSSGLGASAGALFGLGAAVVVAGLIAYGLWMLLRLALAFPACVVERIGVMDALRRGVSLSGGTKGRIFLLYLLGGILNYLLSLVVTVPLTIALALIPALQGPQHAQAAAMLSLVAGYGMGLAAQALTKPVYAIAFVLFYFDQRIRHEGFDIEWMMMRAGLTVPAAPQKELQLWTPADPSANAATAAITEEVNPTEPALPAAAAAEAAAASGEPL
jgi:hypothetical protein